MNADFLEIKVRPYYGVLFFSSALIRSIRVHPRPIPFSSAMHFGIIKHDAIAADTTRFKHRQVAAM